MDVEDVGVSDNGALPVDSNDGGKLDLVMMVHLYNQLSIPNNVIVFYLGTDDAHEEETKHDDVPVATNATGDGNPARGAEQSECCVISRCLSNQLSTSNNVIVFYPGTDDAPEEETKHDDIPVATNASGDGNPARGNERSECCVIQGCVYIIS